MFLGLEISICLSDGLFDRIHSIYEAMKLRKNNFD